MYNNAIACGRFQPFHNDHLEYLLSALNQSKFLWIGITKPFANFDEENESHRQKASSNPFNFIDRLQMVRNSLLECGVPAECFCIIPFDFENPLIKQSMPPSDLVLVTITDNWSNEKIEKLKNLGKKVEVLFEKMNPEITGTIVREMIVEKDEDWRKLVPPAVVRYIDRMYDHA